MLINIILIVVVIIAGVLLASYNSFIRLNNSVKQSESNIDVLLNQRFDLLPNLIETVKGYTKHESLTLNEITDLRTNYQKSNFSVEEASKIDKSFSKVIAIAENYPELKANTNFLSLQSELKEIENKLNSARLIYNNTVTRYNTKVESVPSNLIAKMFNFEKKDLFKLDDSKKENIKINF